MNWNNVFIFWMVAGIIGVDFLGIVWAINSDYGSTATPVKVFFFISLLATLVFGALAAGGVGRP